MNDPRSLLEAMLRSRTGEAAARYLASATGEGLLPCDSVRFASRLALTSRHLPREPLAPTLEELRATEAALPGWNPERWNVLEAGRVLVVLAQAEADPDRFPAALEDAFRYADEGELVALYRSLALLPCGERHLARAREGCRTNIRPVFEAIATDNPYPARHFDEAAWNQMVIKAIFVGAPAWRIQGLDDRLNPELARMALDLREERRSAGRPLAPELFACLGAQGGERARRALEEELAQGEARTRAAAALAWVRAGLGPLPSAGAAGDSLYDETLRAARAGAASRLAFRPLAEAST